MVCPHHTCLNRLLEPGTSAVDVARRQIRFAGVRRVLGRLVMSGRCEPPLARLVGAGAAEVRG